MSVKYDLYQNPPSARQSQAYHVRLKSSGMLTTGQLAREIEHATSLTASDVKGALMELSRLMREGLANGKRVHLEGIGYFSLAASAPVVTDPQTMRAEHVRVKGVTYQPEKDLLAELDAQVRFERTSLKMQSSKKTMEELKRGLEQYFASHVFITRAEFGRLFGLTRSTAIDRLGRLTAEGFLQRKGAKNAPVYVLAVGQE